MIKINRINRKKLLKELNEAKRRNFEDNLKFVRFYSAWIKSKTNKEWSKSQKILIETFYRPQNKRP